MNENEKNYQDFFRKEIYDGFVNFLIGKLGSAKVIALIGDDPLFTKKKGVHVQLRRLFNEFLSKNKNIEKVFAANGGKCYMLRNICDEPLAFPINTADDELMVKQNIRPPKFVPTNFDFPRAGKKTKKSAEPMKNQILKGDWKEHKFFAPEKLVVHFKKSYASKIKKTTVTYDVNSREEIADIILDRFKDRVAFAQCQGRKVEFVRKKTKENEKNFQNKVQQ